VMVAILYVMLCMVHRTRLN